MKAPGRSLGDLDQSIREIFFKSNILQLWTI